jgi:uncharacterized protein YndB with AHSA1/START domain
MNKHEIKTIKIAHEITINAPKEKVFAAMINDVGDWWGAPFLCTSNPTALIVEPWVGGRFLEQGASKEEGHLWAVVSAFIKNERIEFRGPMGMSEAVNGAISWELESKDSGTVVKTFHYAFGPLDDETEASYTWGWGELMGNRLKAFVEEEKRLGIKANL